MNRCLALLPLLVALPLIAQQTEPSAAPTQLTIYNQDFALARTTIPLDLHAGANEVLTTNVTSQLEPDSVVLRDPAGRNEFKVAEQNYDAAIVNQQWLLEKYEGKTIDFQTYGMQVIETATGEHRTLPATIVQGRIIRAGNQPLIEVNGKMQFSLPGMPLFPASTDGLLLKPTLRWQIESDKAERFPAELAYITHGMSWQATYNVVLPEASDTASSELADILGWVTIQNNSGTDFSKATIQLMAGDVAKLQEWRPRVALAAPMSVSQSVSVGVTQKAFDDFHLYDLHRTLALRNGETKQVQFLEASGVKVERTYQYEGNYAIAVPLYSGYHNDQQYFEGGSNTQVAILQEIRNSTSNRLGMPLPAGRLRLYRRDTGGQMQFVGESMISHTPAEQTVKMISGNAFDLTGHRRQTDFHVDNSRREMDESFEIKLSNQKSHPIVIHDIEHMNRGQNWEITAKSADFVRQDSSTADFPITVPAKGDATLTYTVHYSW